LGDAESFGYALSKVRSEVWVSIADNLSGETKPMEHVFEVELCDAGAGDRGGTG
jgi:hypothetical protein